MWEDTGDGSFAVLDPATAMPELTLQPGRRFRSGSGTLLDRRDRGYAVRATQYEREGALMGGSRGRPDVRSSSERSQDSRRVRGRWAKMRPGDGSSHREALLLLIAVTGRVYSGSAPRTSVTRHAEDCAAAADSRSASRDASAADVGRTPQGRSGTPDTIRSVIPPLPSSSRLHLRTPIMSIADWSGPVGSPACVVVLGRRVRGGIRQCKCRGRRCRVLCSSSSQHARQATSRNLQNAPKHLDCASLSNKNAPPKRSAPACSLRHVFREC